MTVNRDWISIGLGGLTAWCLNSPYRMNRVRGITKLSPYREQAAGCGDCSHPVDTSRYMGVSQAEWRVCVLGKKITSGEDLHKAIQRAIAFVGQMPKEVRYRPI